MSNTIIDNPYTVEHYGYSWEDTRKLALQLIQHFPQKYKLAYCNDYYQKIILLVNQSEAPFDIENSFILAISKIDASAVLSLLAFEISGYYGSIESKDEEERGWASMRKFSSYLRYFEA